ncbi:hypothetical protein Hanom_Chr01g00086451 [Helianthus anomalus]
MFTCFNLHLVFNTHFEFNECVDIGDLRRNRVCVGLNCLATFRACLLSTQLTLRLQDEAEAGTSTDAGVYGDPDGVSFMNVCKRGMKPNGVYVGSDPSLLRYTLTFDSLLIIHLCVVHEVYRLASFVSVR